MKVKMIKLQLYFVIVTFVKKKQKTKPQERNNTKKRVGK